MENSSTDEPNIKGLNAIDLVRRLKIKKIED